MTKKVALECELSDEAAAGMEAVVASTGKPASWHVGQAIENYLAYHDFFMTKVARGVAELDAGRGLSDGEAARWIDALESDPDSRPPE